MLINECNISIIKVLRKVSANNIDIALRLIICALTIGGKNISAHVHMYKKFTL